MLTTLLSYAKLDYFVRILSLVTIQGSEDNSVKVRKLCLNRSSCWHLTAVGDEEKHRTLSTNDCKQSDRRTYRPTDGQADRMARTISRSPCYACWRAIKIQSIIYNNNIYLFNHQTRTRCTMQKRQIKYKIIKSWHMYQCL